MWSGFTSICIHVPYKYGALLIGGETFITVYIWLYVSIQSNTGGPSYTVSKLGMIVIWDPSFVKSMEMHSGWSIHPYEIPTQECIIANSNWIIVTPSSSSDLHGQYCLLASNQPWGFGSISQKLQIKCTINRNKGQQSILVYLPITSKSLPLVALSLISLGS